MEDPEGPRWSALCSSRSSSDPPAAKGSPTRSTPASSHSSKTFGRNLRSALRIWRWFWPTREERGDPNRVKELSGFALETADSADGQTWTPGEPLDQVRAMAWSNLAYVRLIHEKQDGAEAQQTAQAYAARLDDPDTLGTMYLNQALMTEGWEPRLQLIRQAGALIIRGSSKQSAYVSLQLEALTLIRLREYDAAQAALQEGRRSWNWRGIHFAEDSASNSPMRISSA